MTVSFTGYKNIGYMPSCSSNYQVYNKAYNIQVTNDESGNHLDEFNKILEKTKTTHKYHMDTPGLISLFISRQNGNQYEVELNNNNLEINDTNLPIFSYLAKITDEISKKEEDEIVCDENVLEDDEIYDNTFLGLTVKIKSEKEKEDAQRILKSENYENVEDSDIQGLYMYMAYRPEQAIRGSKRINQTINKIMSNYFDV